MHRMRRARAIQNLHANFFSVRVRSGCSAQSGTAASQIYFDFVCVPSALTDERGFVVSVSGLRCGAIAQCHGGLAAALTISNSPPSYHDLRIKSGAALFAVRQRTQVRAEFSAATIA